MPLVVVLFQIQDDCYIIHVKNNFPSKVEVIYNFILRSSLHNMFVMI